MPRTPITERQQRIVGSVLEHVSEDPAMEAQDGSRPLDVGHGSIKVGDVLDARLGITGMCKALGISRATFYRRERRGYYTDFLILPQLGPKAWSGEKVQRWLKGESRLRPMFGRRRAG